MPAGGAPSSPAGSDVALTSSVVSASGTSAALVGNNPARNVLILQNDHATQIAYVTLATSRSGQGVSGGKPVAPTAVLNSGIRLLPVAANTVILYGYTGPAAVIASGSSTPVLVTEY